MRSKIPPLVRWKAALAAISLAGLVFLAPSCGVRKGEVLPEVRNPVDLTLFQRLAMMALVRQAFSLYPSTDRFKEIPQDPKIPDTGNQPVFVSIFHKASPMVWGVGFEGNTQQRILGAVAMIMKTKTFEKYYIVDRERIAIKIDILTGLLPIKVKSNGGGASIEPGIHGLMLQKGKQRFFQLPTDFIVLGWEEEGYSPRDRKLRMLRELSEQAGIGGKGWLNYNVYRFRTTSFLQEAPDYAPLPLYRGNPSVKKFTTQDVQDSALKAGRQIQQNVEPNGRFRYVYDPVSNETSGFLDYDPTFHATGLYALSILFQYSKRLEIIEQTKLPLLWLVRHLETPRMEPEAACVQYQGNAKTSASAMTLLALTAMPPKVIAELGTARVNRLANYLTILQTDGGRFFPTYYHKLFGYMPRKRPGYLDGLAMTALARYYQVNSNTEWLAAAKKAADDQIAEFRRSGEVDAWTVQGLYDLWKIESDERYAKACLEMADKLLARQISTPKKRYADYVGGFEGSTPPRVFQAAVRSEALSAAFRLSRDLGIDAQKYEEAVLRATGFILNNQFTKQNSYYLALPDEAVGAMKSSLFDNRIALATQEHALLALIAAFDVQSELFARRKAEMEAQGKSADWKKMSPEQIKQEEERRAKIKAQKTEEEEPSDSAEEP